MILLCLILVNLAIIFFFSHQSSTVSTSWSNSVSRLVETHTLHYESKTQAEKSFFHATVYYFIRNGAHVLLFFTLGIFVFWFLHTFRFRWYTVIGGILFGIIFAFSDEFHQTYIPGRTFEWKDIAHDIQGFVAGMLLFLLIIVNGYYFRKRKKETTF